MENRYIPLLWTHDHISCKGPRAYIVQRTEIEHSSATGKECDEQLTKRGQGRDVRCSRARDAVTGFDDVTFVAVMHRMKMYGTRTTLMQARK